MVYCGAGKCTKRKSPRSKTVIAVLPLIFAGKANPKPQQRATIWIPSRKMRWHLIKERVGKPVHFVGLSMGGFVGMRLAIHHPEWLLSLSLLETSADPEPKENLLKYKILPKIARIFGMWIVAPQAMKIMFGKTFLTDPARKSQRAEMRRRLLQNDKINIAKAIDGVFSRQGVYEYLPSIKTPTLIVVGDEDIATIPAKSRRMNTAIKNSQLVVIPHAGHTQP
jgi:3-oxoadipate enol-lactonase